MFDLSYFDEEMHDLFIPTVGKHIVRAAAFAIACGILCGIDENSIRRGLMSYTPVAMRQRMIKKNGYTIIEDCYNASPESMRAALDVMREEADRHKARAVAVLGEMRDLGSFSIEMHKGVGKYAAERADVVFIFGQGENQSALACGCEYGGKKAIMLGDDHVIAAELIKHKLLNNDIVLIKASRAVRLEKLSEKL